MATAARTQPRPWRRGNWPRPSASRGHTISCYVPPLGAAGPQCSLPRPAPRRCGTTVATVDGLTQCVRWPHTQFRNVFYQSTLLNPPHDDHVFSKDSPAWISYRPVTSTLRRGQFAHRSPPFGSWNQRGACSFPFCPRPLPCLLLAGFRFVSCGQSASVWQITASVSAFWYSERSMHVFLRLRTAVHLRHLFSPWGVRTSKKEGAHELMHRSGLPCRCFCRERGHGVARFYPCPAEPFSERATVVAKRAPMGSVAAL